MIVLLHSDDGYHEYSFDADECNLSREDITAILKALNSKKNRNTG